MDKKHTNNNNKTTLDMYDVFTSTEQKVCGKEALEKRWIGYERK